MGASARFQNCLYCLYVDSLACKQEDGCRPLFEEETMLFVFVQRSSLFLRKVTCMLLQQDDLLLMRPRITRVRRVD
jgi:hypothetical protein